MKATVPKLAFDNGGAFIQDTRREVEQYLSRGRTRVKGAAALREGAHRARADRVLVDGADLLHPGLLALLCLVGLVLGATLTAFCVQHDANHGAYFKQRR